eukprot:scaffold230623_cov57-Attheya_sp.AAC.1
MASSSQRHQQRVEAIASDLSTHLRRVRFPQENEEFVRDLLEEMVESVMGNQLGVEATATDTASSIHTNNANFLVLRDAVQQAATTLASESVATSSNDDMHVASIASSPPKAAAAAPMSFSLFDMLDRQPLMLQPRVTGDQLMEVYAGVSIPEADEDLVFSELAKLFEKVEDLDDIASPGEWNTIQQMLQAGIDFTRNNTTGKDGGCNPNAKSFLHVHTHLFELGKSSSGHCTLLQYDLVMNLVQSLKRHFTSHAHVIRFTSAQTMPSHSFGMDPLLELVHEALRVFHRMLIDMATLVESLDKEQVHTLFRSACLLLRTISIPDRNTAFSLWPAHIMAGSIDVWGDWLTIWSKQMPPFRFIEILTETGLLLDIVQRCRAFGEFISSPDETSHLSTKTHLLDTTGENFCMDDLNHGLFVNSISMLRTILVVTRAGVLFPYHIFSETWAEVLDLPQTFNSSVQTDTDIAKKAKTEKSLIGNSKRTTSDVLRVLEPFVALWEVGITCLSKDGVSLVDSRLACICGEAFTSVMRVTFETDWDIFFDVFVKVVRRMTDATRSIQSFSISVYECYRVFSLLLTAQNWSTIVNTSSSYSESLDLSLSLLENGVQHIMPTHTRDVIADTKSDYKSWQEVMSIIKRVRQ